MRYRMTVTFQGIAFVEMEAASADEAREMGLALEPQDLARAGFADFHSFKVALRDVKRVDDTAGEDEAARPIGKRPSGWYRPK